MQNLFANFLALSLHWSIWFNIDDVGATQKSKVELD